MKTLRNTLLALTKTAALTSVIAFSTASYGNTVGKIVDDFSDNTNNNLGLPRQYITDATAGGATKAERAFNDGVFHISGDITPPRGQPGWASSVLLLDPKGMPIDASQYTGVRLLIKINKGNVSVSANSTEVTNFDYHAAPIAVAADGKFHEVKLPFNKMKRAWSAQTPLNTKTLNSLSIVAYSMQNF